MLRCSCVVGRHPQQKRKGVTSDYTSQSSSASASSYNSAFQQDFTNIGKSYPADLLTYKKSQNGGKCRISKEKDLWHRHNACEKNLHEKVNCILKLSLRLKLFIKTTF